MSTHKYDPKKVKLTFNGQEVTGFDAIEVKQIEAYTYSPEGYLTREEIRRTVSGIRFTGGLAILGAEVAVEDRYGAPFLVAHIQVIERDLTQGTLRPVVLVEEIRPEWRTTRERLIKFAFHTVKRLVEHEVAEGFMFCDTRPFDPHAPPPRVELESVTTRQVDKIKK